MSIFEEKRIELGLSLKQVSKKIDAPINIIKKIEDDKPGSHISTVYFLCELYELDYIQVCISFGWILKRKE